MRLGLGLEKAGTNPPVMKRALELGIRFFDAAPSYSYGLCEANFCQALKESGVKREEVFISTKTHDREPKDALALLERSLNQLQTDYIDLWSLHDLSTPWDLVVEDALVEAKKSGKVKNIGITCNKNPVLLKQVLEKYKFDYVMIPINIADKHRSSFIIVILPIVGETKVIAMQVFLRGKSHYPLMKFINKEIKLGEHICPNDHSIMMIKRTYTTSISAHPVCPKCGYAGEEDVNALKIIQDCMRYTGSFPIDTMLIGASNVDKFEQDVQIFNEMTPMTLEETQAIEEKTRPYADMLNYYKDV